MTPHPLRFGVAILAAGFSTRMGRPKMLLPWGATSMIGHLLAQWQSLGAAHIGVVCGADQPSLHAELDRLEWPASARILNPRPEEGMFGSILCAASWTKWRPGLTHWAIALGDQPHLRIGTLRALLDFAATHPTRICQPTYSGRPRHPVVLPCNTFEELRNPAEEHLKQFLQTRADQVLLCRLDDPGLDLDLDEPADYERALRLRSKSPTGDRE